MTASVEVSNKDMETIVQDHEQRILKLEQSYSDLKSQLVSVETGQLRIERTLLDEGREQKKLLAEQRKEQKELMDQLIAHTLGIKQTNSNKKWELALAIVGGGGFLYAVVDLILQYWKG
ncbi:hypothetical protein [Niallia sp.]|uniref:hypothetical protein n=1 Tax=Niallia sp. TaxID=2837523 RepID=UPI002899BC9E|nr:hypothetical protein [Niallia sp.]